MKTENIKPGEKFSISTDGNKLSVTVGTPITKSKRSTLDKLSFEVIRDLTKTLELSGRKLSILCSKLRTNLGRNMVDSCIGELDRLHEELAEYFEVKSESFMEDGREIERSLVFVKNTSDLILHVIQQRNLDPQSCMVRISVDGGQGFLKVVVNVFDPSEKHSTSDLDDAGVKRSIILALVEDVPEENHNLHKLLNPLKLNEVKYNPAFDLKCYNAAFGLSTHAGKYACLWCEGECTLEAGEKRTCGSIDNQYRNFDADGRDHKKMMEYKNCISPRILYLDEPEETLIEKLVPPPELHIFIGIISMFVKVLLSL